MKTQNTMYNLKRNASEKPSGFSLIELLIVLGIIVLIAGLTTTAVRRVQESGRRAKCSSNLRQMAMATLAYAEDHGGQFPWGSRFYDGKMECWDFTTVNGDVTPGAIWDGYGINSVMQCPSYLGGNANWKDNPYTGYNYNCSFVGKVQGDSGKRSAPAKLAHLKNPSRTALFGDGQYEGGANKFMRSPKRDVAFDGSSKSIRLAGTQGFRHGGKTLIAFCDGHVEILAQPYQYGGAEGFTDEAGECGFISADNSLYSGEISIDD